MDIISLEIDAFTRTIGQSALTTQLALGIGADLTGDTGQPTGSTVGDVGLEIDTYTGAIGQALLTSQLAFSLRADFA
jgi:hypothetical protein